MFRVALPVFVTVKFWDELVEPPAWLPNAKLVFEKLTCGLPVPVPERATDCGLSGASSLRVTAAAKEPTPLGANWTLMVQLAPAARLVPQLSVSLKLVG
jgi:hypothetical protein